MTFIAFTWCLDCESLVLIAFGVLRWLCVCLAGGIVQRTKQENFLVSFCAFFPHGSDNKASTFAAKTNEIHLKNVDLKIFKFFF